MKLSQRFYLENELYNQSRYSKYRIIKGIFPHFSTRLGDISVVTSIRSRRSRRSKYFKPQNSTINGLPSYLRERRLGSIIIDTSKAATWYLCCLNNDEHGTQKNKVWRHCSTLPSLPSLRKLMFLYSIAINVRHLFV